MTIYRALAVLCVLSFLVAAAEAQTLTVYDDAVQHSFTTDQSYPNPPNGSVNFDSAEQAHTGTKSIKFVGNSFGAVVFDRTAQTNLSTATYPVLRFWVHGGATGGQQLRVLLKKDIDYFPNGADVDSFITGGAIAAGTFREVVINLTQPPFSADAFDRIEIQSDVLDPQSALFIDDVTLGQVAAQAAAPLQILQNDTVAGMLHERFIGASQFDPGRSDQRLIRSPSIATPGIQSLVGFDLVVSSHDYGGDPTPHRVPAPCTKTLPGHRGGSRRRVRVTLFSSR